MRSCGAEEARMEGVVCVGCAEVFKKPCFSPFLSIGGNGFFEKSLFFARFPRKRGFLFLRRQGRSFEEGF